MIFKFRIVSDEVENFKREIKIDADATFWDLKMPFAMQLAMIRIRCVLFPLRFQVGTGKRDYIGRYGIRQRPGCISYGRDCTK